MTNSSSLQLFALILAPCIAAYLVIRGMIVMGRNKSNQLLPPKNEARGNNPICPFDLMDCSPNLMGFSEMDGYLNCSDCPRYCNGVRATGAMPNLEAAVKAVKNVSKLLTNKSEENENTEDQIF